MAGNHSTITIQDQHFKLLPGKVVLWEHHNTLLVADAHFGKVSHFRKSGLAVPVKALDENADRLNNLLLQMRPRECIFLGDLFHSHLNNDWQNFEDVVTRFSNTHFMLIRGNHDIIEERLFANIGIEIRDELFLDGFHLTHHPVENPEVFNICGHLHPGVKLSSKINYTEKLPCFHLQQNQLILPSFGSFTGKKAIRPKQGARVFVVAGEEVIEFGKS